MSLPAALKNRLRLPLIAAPMFLVSGPALVKAACRASIVGSFPTANCRTVEELDRWLADMSDDLLRAAHRARPGATLSQPDRPSLQPAAGRRSRRRPAQQGGAGDHQRRLARAGDETA
jgi:NAD(P)H-dependent flavin oxidoreductase YrpB (nitropropane dioxygenase family)